MCEHGNFAATVTVNRILEKESSAHVAGFMAEVRVSCSECGLPFEFVGVDAGLRFDKPSASLDAQELRAPIRPKGSKIFPALPGFDVRAM